MRIFGKTFFEGSNKPEEQSAPVQQQRHIDVPQKVYVQREGPYHEWSPEEPAALKQGIYDLVHGYYARQNFIELFYCLPEVFAPVHEIANRVSDANWQLLKDWNDEVDYKDPDFNRLFTQPNPAYNFKSLVYNAVCYEILTGRQFFHFNRPATLPDEYKSIITWQNLPAQSVHVEMKKGFDPYTATSMSDFVVRYKLPNGTSSRVFEPGQVLPIFHPDLANAYDFNKCMPLIIGAEKAIRNLIPVYEARGVIYIKRGMMGLFVSAKSDGGGLEALTPKEKESVVKTVNDMYGLKYNKSTIGVTDQPVNFIKTSMSISEMEPFTETLADAVAIYKVLGVPRHLVPSKDNSTFSNADADMKAFYQDVIIPWASRYAQSWTNYMKLANYRRYIRADYSHIQVLQENRKEKADVDKVNGDVYEKRFLNGVCTLNDWIVANDGNKVTGNPIYDKKIFEMTPEELETVGKVLKLKAPAPLAQPKPEGEEAEVIPLKKVVNE